MRLFVLAARNRLGAKRRALFHKNRIARTSSKRLVNAMTLLCSLILILVDIYILQHGFACADSISGSCSARRTMAIDTMGEQESIGRGTHVALRCAALRSKGARQVPLERWQSGQCEVNTGAHDSREIISTTSRADELQMPVGALASIRWQDQVMRRNACQIRSLALSLRGSGSGA